MHIVFFIINILFLIYILAKIKNKGNLSTGLKVLFGFGAFCSFGSFVILTTVSSEINEKNSIELGSSMYSIIAIILYSIYISKTKKIIHKNPDIYTNEMIKNITRICANCGTKLDASAKFCSNCGEKYENGEQKKIESSKLDKNIENKQQQMVTIMQQIEALKTEKTSLQLEIDNFDKKLNILYTDVSDYSNITSQEIKNKLSSLKLDINDIIKNGTATTVNGILNKAIKSNIKQIIRSFNVECQMIIDNLTINNIDTSRSKFEKSFNSLNKLYEIDLVQISKEYYELKLQELTLNYEYLQQLEEEKEMRRIQREQIREETKVLEEIKNEKMKIDKEERHLNNEMSRLMKFMHNVNNDIEKQLYIDKIKDLEEKLKVLDQKKENVLDREKNTRSGFVYVISNIGSFGENVYKIGMTRRLEPQDRIDELGDASVPFKFDLHAIVFSDDTPTLETELHRILKDYQVNKMNNKKEFFKVELSKIKEVLNNYPGINITYYDDIPKATEYRESIKIEN